MMPNVRCARQVVARGAADAAAGRRQGHQLGLHGGAGPRANKLHAAGGAGGRHEHGSGGGSGSVPTGSAAAFERGAGIFNPANAEEVAAAQFGSSQETDAPLAAPFRSGQEAAQQAGCKRLKQTNPVI
ncbi:hypothetical protein HYH02_001327 [Chlamydomonas schloesseri]|uniref:Uncharacterized protein n=1 Tax=Chlamydomonas schloesseri TaxID=2026947 RepID=A0A836BCJ1_9CHLO|nr:hypothetical protein HYH02_001327 [Chlamydomonas schloesseri]|eukprot:KAG2454298.1 hypothetical protein HYH02_001327 [Chlamydomonas schloesseri]